MSRSSQRRACDSANRAIDQQRELQQSAQVRRVLDEIQSEQDAAEYLDRLTERMRQKPTLTLVHSGDLA